MSKTKTPAEAPVADRMAAARAARAAKQAAAKASEAGVVTAEAQPTRPEDDKLGELPAGQSLLERAAANAEEKRLAKIAALRAAKQSHSAVTDPIVQARILKKGHGQISTGEHISGLGDLTYDFGEIAALPHTVAADLEERGFVEIQ